MLMCMPARQDVEMLRLPLLSIGDDGVTILPRSSVYVLTNHMLCYLQSKKPVLSTLVCISECLNCLIPFAVHRTWLG